MKKLLLALTVSMFGLVLVGCGGDVTLGGVYESLETSGGAWLNLADDGSFITVTSDLNCPPNDENPLCDQSNTLNTILEELGFGQNVRQRMSTTRALDGRQDAENDDFRVSWTFHPDNGLQVLFEYR